MLTKEDIDYLIDHYNNDGSEQAEKLEQKLKLIKEQADLQESFREKSVKLQEQFKELNK